MSALIVANWKMNGDLIEGKNLSSAIYNFVKNNQSKNKIVICPPFTLLDSIGKNLKDSPIILGAQDCHEEINGSYTGDISAAMLKGLNCEYVILGHSERREGHDEDNNLIRSKAEAAHAAGLKTIICVGEKWQAREESRAMDVVREQVLNSLPHTATKDNTIIAYEPVWAIGSGKTPTSNEIAEIHQLIKKITAPLRVIYGGSANEKNVSEILSIDNVDGLLVGRASLDADKFCKMIGN